MTLPEALAAASTSLTDGCATEQDVAAKLTAARCEGKRGSPVKCPLARWFSAVLRENRALPRRLVVTVDGTTWGKSYLYVHVRPAAGRGPDACPPVPVPALAVRFASTFDSGGFPELSA
jgi:hypothetical protein